MSKTDLLKIGRVRQAAPLAAPFRPTQNAILKALGFAVRSSLLAIGALAFSVTAFADNLSLTELPPQGAVMGGVYTSPYTINVNGVNQLLICDDFTTEIYLNTPWNASPSTLTSVSGSSVALLKFDNTSLGPILDSDHLYGLTAGKIVDDYAMAAVLSAELLTMPGIGTPAENTLQAGELSYAIWSLFDNNLYTSLNASGHSTGYGNLTDTEVADMNNDLQKAAAKVGAATSSGVVNLNEITVNGHSIDSLRVYTPNPLGAAQEFLQASVPEPSSLPILLIGVLGLFGVGRHRRLAKTKV